MSVEYPKIRRDRLQVHAVQAIFIFINLVLIETHLPGMLWVAIGGVFWVTMILLAAVGGSWMCGWVCWIGSMQDFAEPFARSRVQLNARWGRNITLIVLISWVPVVWWLMPEVKAAVYTPFGVSLDTWTRHLFQVGLMLVIALSVMVLGKRGICKYLCPFNRVVRIVRQWLPRALYEKPTEKTSAQVGCACCTVTCRTLPSAQTELKPVPIPPVVSGVKQVQSAENNF